MKKRFPKVIKDDHRLHVLIVKDNRKLATKYQPFNANIHSFVLTLITSLLENRI